MAYNIDNTISVADPGHVEHHEAMAEAINDLDVRVSASVPKIIALDTVPEVSDPNTMELSVAGVLRNWWNEWRALRGRNPYPTWADALVRAFVYDGDNTNGNAVEILDNRTGHAASVIWGVNWGTGRITQGDISVGMVYVLTSAQTTADIPSTLPPGTLIVRRTT